MGAAACQQPKLFTAENSTSAAASLFLCFTVNFDRYIFNTHCIYDTLSTNYIFDANRRFTRAGNTVSQRPCANGRR
jgi:hypothetical protein